MSGEYLIEYEKKTCIIICTDKKELKLKIINKLKKSHDIDLTNFRLQAYHSRFSAFYDLDEEEDVPDEGRLKVINMSPIESENE